SIFSLSDSTNYYFVVNVGTATTNLSSSRFGIGQFNRANYAGKGIKHQLIPVGTDNQLIFVGRFLTLGGVKKYAQEIIPLMPEIMKVPKDKYSFFIITQENLNKLANKQTLDNYIDYYQKNY
ncbi:MAG: gliding motility protein, partial [Bacteroidota bacterium]|nr:gliding motility protein [Bacteroidota bacterium]